MGSPDPIITYLKSFGWSAVRLPRTNIRPLQILIKEDNTYTSLGELTTVLRAGPSISVPAVTADVEAADFEGRRSSDLKIGVGLNLLGAIIGAMGGSKLGLEVAYERAKAAAFEFSGVLQDSIEIAALDRYLSDADVDPFSHHVGKLLEADKIYVITGVVKSAKFIVDAKGSSGVGVELEVPIIQAAVGGNVKVSGAADKTAKISFEGKIPLVFGFQAVRLFFDGGRYTAFDPESAGAGALRGLGDEAEENKPEPLVTESPFARLVFD